MTAKGAYKDPTTKYDLLDKMMSRDFDGDIASLAVDRKLRYERTRPNVLKLEFGHSGRTFEIVVRKPRTEEALAAFRAKRSGAVSIKGRGRGKKGVKTERKESENGQQQNTGTGG